MAKKLKIRFAKFERALVMQILEQTGEFEETEHVGSCESPSLYPTAIYLRGNVADLDLQPDSIEFDSNAERDEYLARVIKVETSAV